MSIHLVNVLFFIPLRSAPSIDGRAEKAGHGRFLLFRFLFRWKKMKKQSQKRRPDRHGLASSSKENNLLCASGKQCNMAFQP
jgi:hypothetical protein